MFRDFHAGLMLDAAGRTEEAGKRLKAAYAGDQTTLRLIDAYARNLSRQGKNDEAKAVYLAFDKVQPRNPIVQAALADLAAGKKLEPMVSDVNAAARPKFFTGWAPMASAPPRAGRATKSPPSSSCACRWFSRRTMRWRWIRWARPKPDQAISNRRSTSMTRCRISSPMRVTTDIHIALLLDAMGSSDDSVKRLREIGAQQPDRAVDAWSALADLLRPGRCSLESADAYTRVLDLTRPPKRAAGRSIISAASITSAPRCGTRPSPICKKPSSFTPNSRWC